MLAFFGTWIYCWVAYGFLLGFGLGWLPALILAPIVGFLWPVIAFLLVLGSMGVIGILIFA